MHANKKTQRWLLVLGLLGGALAACAAPIDRTPQSSSPPPEFTVTEQKVDDRVILTVDSDRLIVDVYSQSGIGSAVISLDSGAMPHPVVMRFHLAGLEQMTFGFNDTVVTASVSSHGDEQVLRNATIDDKPVDVTLRGPYWMDVKHESLSDDPAGGYFQVTAPQAFYDSGATMFLIAWIDFYR